MGTQTPNLIEIDPSEMGGLVSRRWAGQPTMRWFLLDPIPPPLLPWRQALTGDEVCAGCGRTNEDDVLRPTRNHDALVCDACPDPPQRRRRRSAHSP
jgi:hypothetical protein